MPRPLSPLGERMRDDLPPVLRRSGDYLAAVHCYASEFDRLEVVVEQVRSQYNPATADLMLADWEREVRLPVGGNGATIAQRQLAVSRRVRRVKAASEGREWEERLDEIAGAGWSYEEHNPADMSSPPANTLKVNLPFGAATVQYAEAARQIRILTAAHIDLEFASIGGFTLDVSQLDVEVLP